MIDSRHNHSPLWALLWQGTCFVSLRNLPLARFWSVFLCWYNWYLDVEPHLVIFGCSSFDILVSKIKCPKESPITYWQCVMVSYCYFLLDAIFPVLPWELQPLLLWIRWEQCHLILYTLFHILVWKIKYPKPTHPSRISTVEILKSSNIWGKTKLSLLSQKFLSQNLFRKMQIVLNLENKTGCRTVIVFSNKQFRCLLWTF